MMKWFKSTGSRMAAPRAGLLDDETCIVEFPKNKSPLELIPQDVQFVLKQAIAETEDILKFEIVFPRNEPPNSALVGVIRSFLKDLSARAKPPVIVMYTAADPATLDTLAMFIRKARLDVKIKPLSGRETERIK